MKNIILILTLNIVFLSSMWNCNDKSDEIRKCNDELFEGMCKKHQQLLQGLFKPKFNEKVITTANIIPNDDVINDIKNGLWALFEVTLVDNIDTEIDMNDNRSLLKSIVNSDFMKMNPYISIFREDNNANNKVYLFVSDINTNYKAKEVISLFKECHNIKEINVICSGSSNKKNDRISYIFSKCENLEKVNLENLNLNRLNADCLFHQCNKLNEIKLQKFNGDKKELDLFALLYDVASDKSKRKRTIKLYCTEYFLLKIHTKCTTAFWQDDNGNKKIIYRDIYRPEEKKKHLQNGDRYREFTLIFDVEEE